MVLAGQHKSKSVHLDTPKGLHEMMDANLANEWSPVGNTTTKSVKLHHFQKKNMHEAKIVARFWIVGIMLALLTFVTLKLR